MAGQPLSPGERVGIRLYCHGLGDCFLLAFPRPGQDRPFRMLIDCGVVLGTPDAKTLMTAVAEDLHAACEGHLDVLVATHEHWDHLSGFNDARAVFETIEIGEIWLAWTEDPKDEQAQALRERKSKAKAVVQRALERRPVGGVQSIMEFFGARSGEGSTSAALEWLQKHPAPKRYLEPDQQIGDLIPGVRVVVLGPPRDEKLLKKSNPSKGDVFELSPRSLNALSTALDALEDANLEDDGQPFDTYYRISEAEAKDRAEFRDYLAQPPRRRIDTDWLSGSDELALQLDSDTNNTSLALAFHLAPKGEYLLFPGDAQVGNWRSWHSLEAVRIQEIFAGTVFYKVGHHGSHNATLGEDGLGLMNHPELTAFVPIDEVRAKAKGWSRTMPWPGLLRELDKRTQPGNLLLADQAASQRSGFSRGPDHGERPLYVEYRR